jgi:dihydroorotase
MRWIVCGLFFWSSVFGQMKYDLLLKGGHVIDPKNGIDSVADVAVHGGKVAAVAANLNAADAAQTVDVHGLYVTPGLVDIHVHVFHTTGIKDAWAGDWSVQPDAFSFRTGVTTMCDAGSSGWRNFETFKHTVIDRVHTRVLAFVNIAGLGMITDVVEQEKSDFKPEEVAKLKKKYPDIIIGVKTAHYQKPDWASVDAALEAGRLAGLPIMVDFGYFFKERPYWQLVTQRLRPGDISTHMFRGPVPWIDSKGKLYRYLLDARERGIKFDIGHGQASLVMRNAVPAIQQGFYPDSISSDLHALSMNAQMMDMPNTMSKLIAMSMPLKEAVLRSTWNPAQIIHHPELGHLTVGTDADIAVFSVQSGTFGYADAFGGKIEGTQRLVCEMTLHNGKLVWDWNGRTGVDYRKLDPEYGVRKGIDYIVPPPLSK